MVVPFIKMHGLGNDYVYIDCFQPQTAELLASLDISELARRMSHRHTGIGSDGLVLMMPSTVADIRMRMFNADGSEAEMCGNASRCIAKYMYQQGRCGNAMTLQTLAGVKHITINDDGPDTIITVEMGKEMGNPHQVFFVDTLDDLNPQFEKLCVDPHYADLRASSNIECACVIRKDVIRMRVCERGTGETMACGTGACATAAAAMDKGLTGNEVTVQMPGGEVSVRRDEQSVIFLSGTATIVYSGTYFMED